MNRLAFFGLAFLPLLVGCGSDPWKDKRPKVVAAAGIVKFKGQALEGATVVFMPTEKGGSSAQGLTDSNGHFTLTAFPPAEGAVPGKYKVLIAKVDTGSTPTSRPTSHDGPAAAVSTKYVIPQKYGDEKTSHLLAEVPADGKEDFTWDLKE